MFIEFGESGALEQGARYLLHGILLPLDGYEEALKLVEWIRPTLTSRVLFGSSNHYTRECSPLRGSLRDVDRFRPWLFV